MKSVLIAIAIISSTQSFANCDLAKAIRIELSSNLYNCTNQNLTTGIYGTGVEILTDKLEALNCDTEITFNEEGKSIKVSSKFPNAVLNMKLSTDSNFESITAVKGQVYSLQQVEINLGTLKDPKIERANQIIPIENFQCSKASRE